MMALDFVKVSQPQIRWLDRQLQILKYKTREKGQIDPTINEERERRRLRREKECPRVVARFSRQGVTQIPRYPKGERKIAV